MEQHAGFLCPECGGDVAVAEMRVQTHFDPTEPWSGVLRRITCAQCERSIPAHLAERWDGMTIDDARSEWRERYRDAK